MVKIENVSIGPQSIKAQMVQKDKVFTDKMCGQDTSTFKKKRETDKEKKKKQFSRFFPLFPHSCDFHGDFKFRNQKQYRFRL